MVTDSQPDEVVAGSETSPNQENAPDSDAPAVIVPADEPIANAAAVILPSVVQIQSQGGVGSGVIYDADGLILTAAHVVSGVDTVTVRFNDGEEMEGTVLGGTSGADVAVVQVDRSGLQAADLALGQEAVVGQMAIAVGSPWGLQGTVTAGIISAVDQSIPSEGSARAVLQTDAAINPGNSGGPLVDREGRVLGINVSIFSLSGANDGVGFAVPIDVASDIAEQVVAGDAIETAFLGVSLGNVESGQAGALIAEVTPGSAADEAGIEVGDLVISIDGVQVQGGPDLAAQVQTHRPGTDCRDRLDSGRGAAHVQRDPRSAPRRRRLIPDSLSERAAGPAIIAGPAALGGRPEGSEAGLIPVLSRNCEAPEKGTSQVA